MSEGTTCYVSPEYFDSGDAFADAIVHEAAHLLHNCKRRTVGSRETRAREWLLQIDYGKRETFAYACEAYARILERAESRAEREALARLFASVVTISDDRVDAAEVVDIVGAAAAARNGWRIILSRCAPTLASGCYAP